MTRKENKSPTDNTRGAYDTTGVQKTDLDHDLLYQRFYYEDSCTIYYSLKVDAGQFPSRPWKEINNIKREQQGLEDYKQFLIQGQKNAAKVQIETILDATQDDQHRTIMTALADKMQDLKTELKQTDIEIAQLEAKKKVELNVIKKKDKTQS